jgi:hypothetical protein
MRRFIVLLSVFAFALLALSVSASAQERYRSPSGPTVTPYLDYFRRDTGALDQYNTFIRPGRQLRQTLRQQNTSLQRLQSQLSNVQGEFQRMRQSELAPTANVPTFLNYSHYYSMGGGFGGGMR